MEWFRVEKIDDETFAISEYKHWEETHCYLLLGTERAVLIDTGLGVANIKSIVDSITALPILVITTHVHWDHIGGHKYFRDFAVHEKEVAWISEKFPISLQMVEKNLTQRPCDFPSDFNFENYNIFQGAPSFIMRDGDIIELGNRSLQVLHTPGHSPGHCCFYEKERGYLYSGDLIYSGCLDAFYPSTNPIDFMHSVDKIRKLNIQKICPSHYEINISIGIVDRIYNAFCKIYSQNKLQQGNGMFDFGDFQIHI